MNTETKPVKRRCGSICCLFGVLAIVIIVLCYTGVIPPPSGSSNGEDKRDDTELTAKRVDRLSFFNNATTSDQEVTVKLELFRDRDWTQDWINNNNEFTLKAVGGAFDTRLILKDMPTPAAPRLRSIRCTVTTSAGARRICEIQTSSDDETLWISSATFWYAKDDAATPLERLCGQIIQTDGTMNNHKYEKPAP